MMILLDLLYILIMCIVTLYVTRVDTVASFLSSQFLISPYPIPCKQSIAPKSYFYIGSYYVYIEPLNDYKRWIMVT